VDGHLYHKKEENRHRLPKTVCQKRKTSIIAKGGETSLKNLLEKGGRKKGLMLSGGN